MDYQLIQTIASNKPCQIHSKENILDLYNSDTWEVKPVAVDKLQFICKVCESKRVYKILPEKVILES